MVNLSPFSTLLLILVSFSPILAGRILFMLPIATQSHKNVFEPFIHGLAARGHEITIVGPSPTKNLPQNVHEIIPLTIADFLDDFLLDPIQARKDGKFYQLFLIIHNVHRQCERVYANLEFQETVLRKGEGHFDLIFFNSFFNQCFFALHHYLKAPFIIVSPMGATLFATRFTGNYYPTSYVPFQFLPFTDSMNFGQRLANFLGSYFVNFLTDNQNPSYEEIYRKYLGEETPELVEIWKNVSLIFGNEHMAVTRPKPNLPDTIQIGGSHCRPSRALPKELEEFVSGAPAGFIYFSLGSIITSQDLRPSHIQTFMNVFSRLKGYRVIWKWDNDQIDGIPENVRVSKWLPQQDILGHPKIKLFITHGGLLSTQEAAYHGVPLIGIPIFVDQDLNMLNAEADGYALTQEILELDESSFEEKVHQVLTNPKFSNRVKELSAIFHDQMNTPLERGVFWSEYVMRHKGAHHLRSAARNLNFWQAHSLDVYGFVGGVLLILGWITKCALCIMCKKILQIFRSTSKSKLKVN